MLGNGYEKDLCRPELLASVYVPSQVRAAALDLAFTSEVWPVLDHRMNMLISFAAVKNNLTLKEIETSALKRFDQQMVQT